MNKVRSQISDKLGYSKEELLSISSHSLSSRAVSQKPSKGKKDKAASVEPKGSASKGKKAAKADKGKKTPSKGKKGKASYVGKSVNIAIDTTKSPGRDSINPRSSDGRNSAMKSSCSSKDRNYRCGS